MKAASNQFLATVPEVLSPVQAVLHRAQEKTVKPETAAAYLRMYGRYLQLRERDPETDIRRYCTQTGSKNTYYTRLAAIEYGLTRELLHATNEALAVGEDSFTFVLHCEVLNRLVMDLKALQSMRGECRLEARHPRRSKRKVLSRLPDDWRERLCTHLARGKYGWASMILATTGCRPAELKQGVSLTLKEGFLEVFILGAKVTEHTGQPGRLLRYSVDNMPFLLKWLAGGVEEAGGRLKVSISNARNLTMAVSRAAKELWPNLKVPVTAYCFRHQSSADLKAALPPEIVAAALGHISTRTQRFYGQRQQASKRNLAIPVEVVVNRDIRMIPHGLYDGPRGPADCLGTSAEAETCNY